MFLIYPNCPKHAPTTKKQSFFVNNEDDMRSNAFHLSFTDISSAYSLQTPLMKINLKKTHTHTIWKHFCYSIVFCTFVHLFMISMNASRNIFKKHLKNKYCRCLAYLPTYIHIRHTHTLFVHFTSPYKLSSCFIYVCSAHPYAEQQSIALGL